MNTKSKAIRSIQFLSDKVIVDQGEHRLFQFCKSCKDGKHLKQFLNDSGANVDLQTLDEQDAIRLERRMFYNLSRGAPRYSFHYEGEAFGTYVKKRRELIKRRLDKQADFASQNA